MLTFFPQLTVSEFKNVRTDLFQRLLIYDITVDHRRIEIDQRDTPQLFFHMMYFRRAFFFCHMNGSTSYESG